MKIRAPRTTVQNTDSDRWLITAEGIPCGVDDLENIVFTVLVPRSSENLSQLTQQALRRAIELLTFQLETEQSGEPDLASKSH